MLFEACMLSFVKLVSVHINIITFKEADLVYNDFDSLQGHFFKIFINKCLPPVV